ncbi:MAG: hypothetical protein ACKVN9_01675 [Methylophilaceae bacterium]
MSHLAAAGQIWRDDCYYLDAQGSCQRKYLLILALDIQYGDCVTVVFTSQPHGLPESPACYIGHPRSGYFLGVLGDTFNKPTWVDFNSLQTLDSDDLKLHLESGRKTLLSQTLTPSQFCAVLRCIMQIQDDISLREYRWLSDTAAALKCP